MGKTSKYLQLYVVSQQWRKGAISSYNILDEYEFYVQTINKGYEFFREGHMTKLLSFVSAQNVMFFQRELGKKLLHDLRKLAYGDEYFFR